MAFSEEPPQGDANGSGLLIRYLFLVFPPPCSQPVARCPISRPRFPIRTDQEVRSQLRDPFVLLSPVDHGKSFEGCAPYGPWSYYVHDTYLQ